MRAFLGLGLLVLGTFSVGEGILPSRFHERAREISLFGLGSAQPFRFRLR